MVASFFAALPVDIFKDRVNYFNYAKNSDIIMLSYYAESFLTLLFNEPIWLTINILLTNIFTPENTVRVIIFVSTFVTYYLIIYKKTEYLFVILILSLSAYIITNHILHLRFALALSIFILGYMNNTRSISHVLFMVTPFVHTIFFVITPLYYISKHYENIKQSRLILSIYVVLYIILLFVFSAHIDGPRQLRYLESDIEAGIGTFIIWFIIFVNFIILKKKFIVKHSFAISIIMLHLLFFYTVPYSRRILDAGIWFIMLAGFDAPTKNKYIFYIMMTILIVVSWYYRVQQSMFGF